MTDSLLSKLQHDRIQALKNHDNGLKTILTTLYAEAARIGKDDGNRESTDAEVTAVIKKVINNNNVTLGLLANETASERAELLKIENKILSGYLPLQLNEAQLVELLTDLNAKGTTAIPDIMKHFKTNYAGQYDGKVLAELIKTKAKP